MLSISNRKKNCAKRSLISVRDLKGFPKSAGTSFKLHLWWLFALLSRGRRGTLSGLSGLWAGTRKVSQNCLSEDKAILNYAKEGPFSGSLVCALRRQWLKITYASWLLLLGCAEGPLHVFAAAAVLAQLGSGELGQWGERDFLSRILCWCQASLLMVHWKFEGTTPHHAV